MPNKKLIIWLALLSAFISLSVAAISHNLFLNRLQLAISSSILQEEKKIETLNDAHKKYIVQFLQQSNIIHDIVQDEVSDSLTRFLALLGLLGTLTVFAGKYWAKQTMKNELQVVKQEMKSEFESEFHNQSIQLTDAASGILGLLVSMENIQFLSDLSFNPISTESRQAVSRYPEVLKKFEEHFKIQTIPVGFYVKLGDVLSLLGRQQLLEADSNHDKDMREAAFNSFKDSINAFTKVLESKPDKIESIDHRFWAEVLCKRGNAFAGSGNYERARADYGDALKIDESYYWAIHSQGDASVALKNYSNAIREYDKALVVRKVPETWYAETWYKKGIAYCAQDEYNKAVECYNQSLKLNPNNSWVLHSLGDSLSATGKYHKAVRKYRKALELSPRQYQTWRALGDVVYMIGGYENYEKAIEKYERASEITSEDGIGDYEIYGKIGDSFLWIGEYSEAVHRYDEAINLKGESFKLWACRAYANDQILRLDLLSKQEREEYQEKIASDRNIAIHKVNETHRRFFRNHQDHSAEKADFLYERAICYALSGDVTKAIEDLKESIKWKTEYLRYISREVGFIALQADAGFQMLLASATASNAVHDEEITQAVSS